MTNYRFIPEDQKRLVVTMLDRGLTPVDVEHATGISVRTVQRVRKLWLSTGQVIQRPLEAGRPRILTSLEVSFLESLVEQRPDIYLKELQHALFTVYDIDVSIDTIDRALRNRGFTRKKISRPARERNEALRAIFQATVGEHYPPRTLVFLDEAACNRMTTRRQMGWARIGQRARLHDYFVRGQRYSVLPAISLDGVLHLDILTRSWTAEEFRAYVEVLLTRMNPYPQPNSVLICDNASVHHFDGLREMVEAKGCRLLYLLPYSPDFNPIEEGFSAMKAWIRRNKDYVLGELLGEDICDPYAMLWNAVFTVMTSESIKGWYKDCGYVA